MVRVAVVQPPDCSKVAGRIVAAQGEGAVILTGQLQQVVVDIAVTDKNRPDRAGAGEFVPIRAGREAALQAVMADLPSAEEEIKGGGLRGLH